MKSPHNLLVPVLHGTLLITFQPEKHTTHESYSHPSCSSDSFISLNYLDHTVVLLSLLLLN